MLLALGSPDPEPLLAEFRRGEVRVASRLGVWALPRSDVGEQPVRRPPGSRPGSLDSMNRAMREGVRSNVVPAGPASSSGISSAGAS